ncbi:PaaI family thioesterase [Methanofollis ethanolicus]|uniref:PaaI family thioesterase n=1 Tax=Methanofollis ethanolicus TaxID=488124 RepID=UPI00082D6841|nr:PaaI family thioesterase [Methanofollis ethanolicus]
MGYLQEITTKGRMANPFFVLMGIDAVSFGEGEAVLSMEVRPDMLNGAGWLQGGVYTALSDEAMALALTTLLDDGGRIATISETTQYFKGVRDGTVRATGRVVRKGHAVAFAEGELTGADGALLARTTASFAVMGQKS